MIKWCLAQWCYVPRELPTVRASVSDHLNRADLSSSNLSEMSPEPDLCYPYSSYPISLTQTPLTRATLPKFLTRFYHCQSSAGQRISGSGFVGPRLNLALPTSSRPEVYSRLLFRTGILAPSCADWIIRDPRSYDLSSSLSGPSYLSSPDPSFELHYTAVFVLPGRRL